MKKLFSENRIDFKREKFKFAKMHTLQNKVDIIEMSNEQGPDDRNHHQLLSQNIPFNSLFSILVWKNLLDLCAREYCREVLLTRHLFQPIELRINLFSLE